MRPSARPSSNHSGRPPPPLSGVVPRCTRKIGTCTRVATFGAAPPMSCSNPTPMYTAFATGLITAKIVTSGETLRNSGTHVAPPRVLRSGAPSTSSTKLSSASRWVSDARMSCRPFGFVDVPTGSANHASFALPLLSRMPSAVASAPKASSSVPMLIVRPRRDCCAPSRRSAAGSCRRRWCPARAVVYSHPCPRRPRVVARS